MLPAQIIGASIPMIRVSPGDTEMSRTGKAGDPPVMDIALQQARRQESSSIPRCTRYQAYANAAAVKDCALLMHHPVAVLTIHATAMHQDPPALAGYGHRLLLSDGMSEGVPPLMILS